MKSEIGEKVSERSQPTNGQVKTDEIKPELATKNGTIELKDLIGLSSQKKFLEKLGKKNISTKKLKKIFRYENSLEDLQIELVKLQRWVQETDRRVAILFEGRDAAGKGGSIRRFIEHLNPRAMRIVALPKPTEEELGQWYFQRYVKTLPNRGEIVFYDRSWYNRAVVEPVNGFCTKEQYGRYMRQVPEFEHMLYEDGIDLIKFWFSISKEEQLNRFNSRLDNPLKRWKFSPVDQEGQKRWDDYTQYKEQMFSKTHTSISPWIIVKTNVKKEARLESIRYLLSYFKYDRKGESGISTFPDPNVIQRYHRMVKQID